MCKHYDTLLLYYINGKLKILVNLHKNKHKILPKLQEKYEILWTFSPLHQLAQIDLSVLTCC